MEPVQCLTWSQRHLDAELPRTRQVGFTPQPSDWMSRRYQKSPNAADFEFSRIMRSSVGESTTGLPQLEYRLWLEAGKYHPANMNKPDANYNANTWRNFCQHFGIDTRQMKSPESPDRRVNEAMAAIYPLNIPKPSKLGTKTFSEYLASSKDMFASIPQHRQLALNRVKEDEQTMKQLRVYSDARHPPLDKQGHILPPEGFRKYEALFLPPTDCEEAPLLEVTDDMEPDMFGQLVRRRPRANLWKLSYRTNNPQYRQAMQFASECKAAATAVSKKNAASVMFPSQF